MRIQTPAERLDAANDRIDKLTDEVALLRRMVASQNEIAASIRREWSMWARQLQMIHKPEGVNAAFMLAQLST